MPSKVNKSGNKVLSENRKARYNYFIETEIECGLLLIGSEVKVLRVGGVNISESYASVEDNELWLILDTPFEDLPTSPHRVDAFYAGAVVFGRFVKHAFGLLV